MKRYDCYYLNDFGDDYSAQSREADDGDWVSFEDYDAEIKQLRGNLSLAEEGLANYAQEVKSLRAELHAIRNQSLVWAMTCPHDCPECDRLYDVIRGAEPQSEKQP